MEEEEPMLLQPGQTDYSGSTNYAKITSIIGGNDPPKKTCFTQASTSRIGEVYRQILEDGKILEFLCLGREDENFILQCRSSGNADEKLGDISFVDRESFVDTFNEDYAFDDEVSESSGSSGGFQENTTNTNNHPNRSRRGVGTRVSLLGFNDNERNNYINAISNIDGITYTQGVDGCDVAVCKTPQDCVTGHICVKLSWLNELPTHLESGRNLPIDTEYIQQHKYGGGLLEGGDEEDSYKGESSKNSSSESSSGSEGRYDG